MLLRCRGADEVVDRGEEVDVGDEGVDRFPARKAAGSAQDQHDAQTPVVESVALHPGKAVPWSVVQMTSVLSAMPSGQAIQVVMFRGNVAGRSSEKGDESCAY